jgi:toxin CcdB
MKMPQFDVFVNPVPSARSAYPLVVTMQSDLAATPTYQLVAPIAAPGKFTGGGRLTPKIELQGKQHAVLVPQMGLVRSRDLSASLLTLAQNRGELLVAAIDLLFYGI